MGIRRCIAHETWMRAQRELERLRASRYSEKPRARAKFRAQVSRESRARVFGSRVGMWFGETQFCRHCNEEIGESGEHVRSRCRENGQSHRIGFKTVQ